ncbi:HK97 family phage prohead protease [Methylobacterium sp. WSM2598]|uniref:HK97 family phage prohead protease n=1 Tax=Methylobacterium sp. WSM2598 TaxID=398261 RepID=UPI00036CB5E2|nr:HK97 family phage prohead protease [Methylobacterium sp. WSM2598]
MSKTYRAARLRSASFDPETNTIEVVWTTGATVRRIDEITGREFDETLSMEPGAVRLDRLNAGAPFCDAHSTEKLSTILGSVVPGSARIEGGRGICTVQLSRAPSVSDSVVKIREGVIRNVSVGYVVHAAETEPQGGDVPSVIVTDWEPMEISAVPVPADVGSQIRSNRSNPTNRTSRNRKPAMTTLPKGRAAPSLARTRARITALAADAGQPELGRKAAEAGVSLQEFRDQLLDHLLDIEAQARRAVDPMKAERREYEQGRAHFARIAKLRARA